MELENCYMYVQLANLQQLRDAMDQNLWAMFPASRSIYAKNENSVIK